MPKMRVTYYVDKNSVDFEACRFDFRIDSKNGLTPSKRKKSERRNSNFNTLFKCKICGSLFESRPALLEHKLLHNDHSCTICEAKFGKKTTLQDHVRKVHGMELSEMIAQADAGKDDDDDDDSYETVYAPVDEVSPSKSSSSASCLSSPNASPEKKMGTTYSPILPKPPGIGIPPRVMSGIPVPAVGSESPATQAITPAALSAVTPSTTLPSSTEPQAANPAFPGYVCINVPIFLSPGNTGTNLVASPQQLMAPPGEFSSLELGPNAGTAFTEDMVKVKQEPYDPDDPCMMARIPSQVVNPFNYQPPPPIAAAAAAAAGAAAIAPQQDEQMPEDNKMGRNALEPGEVRPLLIQNTFSYNEVAAGALGLKNAHVKNVKNKSLSLPVPDQAVPVATTAATTTRAAGPTQPACYSQSSTASTCRSSQMAQTLQSEALDFSKKTREKSPPPTESSNEEAVIDLSCKAVAVKMEDDKIAMLQSYNMEPVKLEKSRPSTAASSRCSSPADLPQGQGQGNADKKSSVKRGRSKGLNNMVAKLWQKKMSQPEPEKDTSVTMEKKPVIEASLVSCTSPFSSSSTGSCCDMPSADVLDLTVKQELAFGKESCSAKQGGDCKADLQQELAADVAQNQGSSDYCTIKFHTCRVCKQLFYSAEEMWEHAVTHEDFHKHKCNMCSYITACRSELNQHKMATHGVEVQGLATKIRAKMARKAAAAAASNATSKQNGSLKFHNKTMYSFQNQRLVCDYPGCGKTFKEWRHLKVHHTLHTGEKPLQCQLCNYSCRHRSSMNWHMKSRHQLDKMKTQGNRTIYVDGEGKLVCGWSDEVNREVSFVEGSEHEHRAVDDEEMDAEDIVSHVQSSVEVMQLETPTEDVATLAEAVSRKVLTGASPGALPRLPLPAYQAGMIRIETDEPKSVNVDFETNSISSTTSSDMPLNMALKKECLSAQSSADTSRATTPDDISQMTDSNGMIYQSFAVPYVMEGLSPCASSVSNVDSEPQAEKLAPVTPVESTPTAPPRRMATLMQVVKPAGQGPPSEFESSVMKFKLKYVTAPKTYQCKVCERHFDSASKMWEHRMKEHEESTRFFCDTCGFESERQVELQSHMLSTHGKEIGEFKDFLCCICGKGYSSKTGLNHHLLRHSEEGPPQFQCPYDGCTSKLHSKGALKNHVRRVHLKVQPKHQCPQDGCQRRFDSSSALRNHQVLHTDQRPLTCDYPGCDKAFRETKHLKVHKMQHNDERPLKCDLCFYSCRQRNSMNWHMKSKHGLDKIITPDGQAGGKGHQV